MENLNKKDFNFDNIKYPLCNKKMENGFLKRRQFFSILKWTPQKIDKNYFKNKETFGLSDFEALICKNCKIVTFKYY